VTPLGGQLGSPARILDARLDVEVDLPAALGHVGLEHMESPPDLSILRLALEGLVVAAHARLGRGGREWL
jgi:hypothetical protein